MYTYVRMCCIWSFSSLRFNSENFLISSNSANKQCKRSCWTKTKVNNSDKYDHYFHFLHLGNDLLSHKTNIMAGKFYFCNTVHKVHRVYGKGFLGAKQIDASYKRRVYNIGFL